MMKGCGDMTRSNKDFSILFNETFRIGNIYLFRFNLTEAVNDLSRSDRPVTATK